MKKIIATLLCLTLTTAPTYAKVFSFGPRAGVSLSQVDVAKAKKGGAEALNLARKMGYHIGAFARFNFFTFYVQPELLITGSGAKFDQNSQNVALTFTKLEAPAMLGLSFFGMARAQIGPVLSLLLKATEDTTNVKEDYKHLTVGWQGGLGVDIWNVLIDLKYESNLSQFGKKIASIHTDHGHSQWILSLGFKIL